MVVWILLEGSSTTNTHSAQLIRDHHAGLRDAGLRFGMILQLVLWLLPPFLKRRRQPRPYLAHNDRRILA